MSDYSKTVDFAAKDGLATGQAAKVIKGTEIDTEFNNIATANATKYDSGDLATQAGAEAGTNNTTLMTPLRTEQWAAVWAAENDGIVGNLHALNLAADSILFWDQSATDAVALTLGTGLSFSATPTLDLDSALTNIVGLTKTDGNFIVANGSAWVAESGATARTSLGVTIGTNVQAWDANLDQIAALAVTDGNFMVGNGSAWVAESGATARTSLGLGSLATASTINNGNWSGTDLAVANGGTAASDAATAATNLGLGTGNNVTHANLAATGTLTVTGASTFNGNVTCNEAFTPVDEIFMGGKIEDDVGASTSINNYAPTGYATCNWISVISSNVTALTGLSGGADGRLILITNPYANGFNLTLTADDAASTAANRFATSASLSPGEGTWVVYDGTDSRWIIMGKA
jgi:hypothetical protein